MILYGVKVDAGSRNAIKAMADILVGQSTVATPLRKARKIAVLHVCEMIAQYRVNVLPWGAK